MTCCSKDPSTPPSLIFPEAIGPSQEENIIGSVESVGATSRTCCRYAPYALIIVLGSFFLSQGAMARGLLKILVYFVSGEYGH